MTTSPKWNLVFFFFPLIIFFFFFLFSFFFYLSNMCMCVWPWRNYNVDWTKQIVNFGPINWSEAYNTQSTQLTAPTNENKGKISAPAVGTGRLMIFYIVKSLFQFQKTCSEQMLYPSPAIDIKKLSTYRWKISGKQ